MPCLLYTSVDALADKVTTKMAEIEAGLSGQVADTFPFLNKNGIEFKLDAVDFLRLPSPQ